jgi:DNA-binding FadR family transcriptional regulator
MEVVLETGLAERDRMVHGAAGPTDPVPSHKAVVEAIRRRHPTQAARAMGKLLDQAIEDVARLEGKHREDRQN